MEVSGQIQVPDSFTRGTNWIKGWVGHRDEEKKNPLPDRIRTPVVQHVA
jgi:hypothetical protein